MSSPNSDLEQMLAALKAHAGTGDRARPPVDQWNPTYCGAAGFEILRDGTWLHEGSHALAMVITGAGFDRMQIFRDGSGLAHASGLAGPTAGRRTELSTLRPDRLPMRLPASLSV